MADFYFIDTREDAKTSEPFAIHNADVAKIWAREFAAGEGHFQPVGDHVVGINRHDLKLAGENTTEKQEEAMKHNAQLVKIPEDNPYKDMTKEDIQDELNARGIEFKAKATKSELIGLLIADDNQ